MCCKRQRVCGPVGKAMMEALMSVSKEGRKIWRSSAGQKLMRQMMDGETPDEDTLQARRALKQQQTGLYPSSLPGATANDAGSEPEGDNQ